MPSIYIIMNNREPYKPSQEQYDKMLKTLKSGGDPFKEMIETPKLPEVRHIPLRKKTLEELLSQLPVSVMINECNEVMFSLHKTATGYICGAYETMEGLPVNMEGIDMQFESTDPANAVGMMIGFLKLKRLM